MADTDVKFECEPDRLEFLTKQNGDKLVISQIDLTKEQAANLAYIVNSGEVLEVEIRIKV